MNQRLLLSKSHCGWFFVGCLNAVVQLEEKLLLLLRPKQRAKVRVIDDDAHHIPLSTILIY